MHSRMLRHRVVTGAVTLTLALGGVAMTGSAATAADAGDRVSAQCTQAKKDLSAAKKKLRAAKRADNAAKVRKAQAKVKAAKQRKAAACAAAPTQESVLEQVQQGRLSLNQLDLSALAAMLPANIAGPLGQLIATMESALESIEGQVPGADAAQLEQLSAAVTNMDPQGIVAALQTLAGSLLAGGATPASLNTLIQMLQGDLPTGNLAIPGIPDLKGMVDQMTAGLPLLAGVDLTNADSAAAVANTVKDGLAAITANVKGPSAGWLAGLAELTKQLDQLGVVDAGAVGSGAALATVLKALLGLAAGSPDPLGALTAVLGNGSLAGVLGLVGILIPGGLLG